MNTPAEPAAPQPNEVLPADYRQKLQIAELRADTLSELTQLMMEGPDPLALAQRAVDLAAAQQTQQGFSSTCGMNRNKFLLCVQVPLECRASKLEGSPFASARG